MDQILDGLQGDTSIADDIVVFGADEEDRDKNLHHLMKRAEEKGLVFNPEKCKIKEENIKFLVIYAASMELDQTQVKCKPFVI